MLMLVFIFKTCYAWSMHNWSTDEEAMKKADPGGYEIWRLEQMISFGEPGEKLPETKIRRHWGVLKDRIDPLYRDYLASLLWPDHHQAS